MGYLPPPYDWFPMLFKCIRRWRERRRLERLFVCEVYDHGNRRIICPRCLGAIGWARYTCRIRARGRDIRKYQPTDIRPVHCIGCGLRCRRVKIDPEAQLLKCNGHMIQLPIVSCSSDDRFAEAFMPASAAVQKLGAQLKATTAVVPPPGAVFQRIKSISCEAGQGVKYEIERIDFSKPKWPLYTGPVIGPPT